MQSRFTLRGQRSAISFPRNAAIYSRNPQPCTARFEIGHLTAGYLGCIKSLILIKPEPIILCVVDALSPLTSEDVMYACLADLMGANFLHLAMQSIPFFKGHPRILKVFMR